MYKIVFLSVSLAYGRQRAIGNLLRHLDRGLFQPTLVLMHSPQELYGESVDQVPVHVLNTQRASRALLPMVRLLRLIGPDLLFSVQDHINVIALLATGLSLRQVKTVVSVRTTPSMAFKNDPQLKNRVMIPFLMRLLYPRADGVVALSQGIADDTAQVASIPVGDISVVYNPIVDERLEFLAQQPVDHPWFSDGIPTIVAVGRLSEEKGFSYLLQAVARVRRQRQVRLLIIGEGPERAKLESLARAKGIGSDTQLLGYRENPYSYLANADVFVLSSLWEGLPAVVVEAMACGAPVVATDCPSGPGEIITKETEGILVPPADPEALADAILRVLSDTNLRQAMRAAGRSRAQDFRVDKIAREYERLFLETLGAARNESEGRGA
ncbi:MAG: glycosyltransferase [Anaerolineae bacterium]|jgi:glycosyltransferase involved in cell wall biosynthesis